MKKLILTLLAAGWAGLVLAQQETPVVSSGDYKTSGFFEGGFWQVLKNPGSAKFQEYRQVKEDLILNRLGFELTKGKYYLNTRVGEAGKTDQFGVLSFGVTRTWKNQLAWSQVPHLLSTSSRLFESRTGPGVYELPDSIQSALEANGGQLSNFLQGAQLQPLTSQRNSARASSEFHPLPEVTVAAGYNNDRKRGTRSHGASFGFTAGELAEELDHETHNLSASAEVAKKDYSASVAYTGQIFNNKIPALVWDNPIQLTDTPDASGRGRMSGYTDHSSHNFTATGAVNLPYKTRSVATVGYGVTTQDEAFLPHTINSTLVDTTGGLNLPAASLDGKFKTLFFNYQVTSKPAEKVSLKGKFRYYRFDNQTPILSFNTTVVEGDIADLTEDTLGRRNLPSGYIRRNFGLETGWHLVRQADFAIGYGREVITRSNREVTASGEDIFSGSLDVRPTDWATLRSSYSHGKKRVDAANFHLHYFEESFPEGEGTVNPFLDSLRRFDVYDRDRDKVELSGQFSPIEELDLGASFSFAQDDFTGVAFGLKSALTRGWSFDLTYSPAARLTLLGSYSWEGYRAEMESRYRNVSGGAGTDNPLDNWGSQLNDRAENYSAGFNVEVWPGRLNWDGDYDFSYTRDIIDSRSVPGGAANGNVTLQYPAVYYKLHSLGSSLSYKINSQTTLKFAYQYEKYLEKDWAIDVMQPYMGAVDASTSSSVFLGATIPPYEVHVLALKLSYAF